MRFHSLYTALILFSMLWNAAGEAPGVGDKIPEVTLRTSEGSATTLTQAFQGKKALLIFYRGGWCPYCNTHLMELKNIEQDLLDQGYRIFAVSPDRPEELVKTGNKNNVHYTLLSDSRLDAAKAFGLHFTVDEATRAKYKTYGIDLEKASGESHFGLPHPAAYLVDEKGIITFKHVNENYKERISGAEILKAIHP